ncbi:S-adenosylmethionine decarboxylase [Prauserella shujinwangii]|uniref:S-adenosylmethionine decarboxylase proenzyme n=1 Tax=Prauserella shujinwangii TaxID=1453103 RepID=A0A2T0M392_9PSEU|nr:adenosylmethionine decarboxylase [Prauserella shujinwangii]PRX51179.1 S-adenosylmethionine decarboxylase [Prauserella shujinwangii]
MPSEFTPVGVFSGKHVLAEFDGIKPELLDDSEFLRRTLADTLTEAGATVCEVIAHQFEPQGVTVLAMLAESHASMHTYPEFGSVFVDVFTCGERADPQQAVRLLANALGTDSMAVSTIQRGRQPATVGK